MASAREGGKCSRGGKYDVFLSFRGPDTRKGFVDCLYENMNDAGIRVFHDNERLHVGEVIGEELMRAIDDSKICMPVFSKGYASSKWCLLELQRIMMGRPGQEVMPVFYDVSPDDVKLQTRLYKDDLEVLEKKHGTDAVDRWRECLKEVCKIKGWNSEEFQGHGKMIKRIVQEVLDKTKKRYKNVTEHLVGIDGQIDAMKKLLDDQIDRVRFVIIHGMGGIGKTTLAKVIFNEVSSNFQGRCFLSNVRESSSQGKGIVKLQQKILNDVLKMSVTISDVDDGVNEIKQRCSNKRVLLVLDDVDKTKQVEKLAGKFDWFERGSRIVITTRDHKVIPNGLLPEGDDNHEDICYYEMPEMDHQHATALFKSHAVRDDKNSFHDRSKKKNSFHDEGLLRKIVATTGGLPLALEVVGSHLLGKTEEVWKETLTKLKKAPHKDVQKVLKISYEALEDDEKEIFLDIACFFRGQEKRIPMYVWKACNLFPVSGADALLHKSLIKIDEKDRIQMHDQLRDLGREIVCEVGKSSRIWIHEEAFQMISNKKGTRDVMLLDLGALSRSCEFEKAAFEELVNLRVLRLAGGNLIGDFSNCFRQLMWLDWSSVPSNFRAKNFSPPNLVGLRLSNTYVDESWIGWKGLLGSKLKYLELSCCGGLRRTPDFSTCLELEVLVLRHNGGLKEMDSSIRKVEQLFHLEMRDFGYGEGLSLLKKMGRAIVTGDSREVYTGKFHLPIEFNNLKSLCHLAIEDMGLESLPKGIGQLKLLKYLSFCKCMDLMRLPQSVWELESLVELNLSRTGLKGFSGKIGSMNELKVLNLSGTEIRTLPEGIVGLVNLEELDLSSCSFLEHIPSEIGNLISLRVLNLDGCGDLRTVERLPTSLSHLNLPYFSLHVVPDISNLVNIVELKLFRCKGDPLSHCPPITDDEKAWWKRFISLDVAWIERFPKLKWLVIDATSDVFNSVEVDLSSIRSVKFRLCCYDAQSLSQLPHSLSELVLIKFRATTLDLSHLRNLSNLFIDGLSSDEIELRGLELLGNLETIKVENCQSLVRLFISSSCPKKLKTLSIRRCPKLVEVEGVSRLVSLKTLLIFRCPSLTRLSDLSNLAMLEDLQMVFCDSIERMPALPRKENLFILDVFNCGKLPNFRGPHFRYVDKI